MKRKRYDWAIPILTSSDWNQIFGVCFHPQKDGDMRCIINLLRENKNAPIEISVLDHELKINGLPKRHHSFGDYPTYGYTIPRINQRLERNGMMFQIRKVLHTRGQGGNSGFVQMAIKL